MKHLFSKSTSGIYLREVHGDSIPDDAVEIPDDVFEKFKEGGMALDVGEDGVPFATPEKPVSPPPDYSRMKADAYRLESDPLFFKEQRGEVPAGTWLSKVNEIKARWPN